MTHLAYVRFRSPNPPDVSALESHLRAHGHAKARLTLRSDAYGHTLEPFIANASIAALLGIKRKRADAVALLRTLAVALGSPATDVFVVRRAEGDAEAARTDASLDALDPALARTPCCVRVR